MSIYFERPFKKVKSHKKFQKLGKKLMVNLHLLHLPGEGQEEAQKGWKFVLRRKEAEATVPCSLSEVQGWNLKADTFHFKKNFNRGNDEVLKQNTNESCRMFLLRYFQIVSKCLLEHGFQPSTSYLLSYWSMQFYGLYYMELRLDDLMAHYDFKI